MRASVWVGVMAMAISSPTWGQVGSGSADPAALIAALGSPRYQEREAATRALIALGPAVRSLVAAAAESPDLEVRSRARRVLRFLSPADTFFAALERAEAGEVSAARREIAALLPRLPKGLRPDPTWVVEILGDVESVHPDDANMSRCIAYHNLLCLLLEAGIDCPRTFEATRAGYLRLIPGNSRACRLLAMVEWEACRPEESDRYWKMAVSDSDPDGGYTAYDKASYHAARGEIELCLGHLEKALEGSTHNADEADKAADFYMIRGEPRFEALIKNVLGEAKRPDATIQRWKGRRRAGPAPATPTANPPGD